MLNNTIWPHI